jgi:hypothetical protein
MISGKCGQLLSNSILVILKSTRRPRKSNSTSRRSSMT